MVKNSSFVIMFNECIETEEFMKALERFGKQQEVIQNKEGSRIAYFGILEGWSTKNLILSNKVLGAKKDLEEK